MARRRPELYINRELSWLEFNQRVLEEGWDERNPLLERLKFLAIVSSNLDEFYMVRVSGVQQQVAAGVGPRGPEKVRPEVLLEQLRRRIRRMVDEQYRCAREEVLPALRSAGLRLLRHDELNAEQRAAVEELFRSEVFPVLSPMGIDPGHPMPFIRNLTLNLLVGLKAADDQRLAIVEVPEVIPRLVPLPADGTSDFMLLEELIAPRVGELFGGWEVTSCGAFRLTRNGDLNIDEEEAEDLLVAIEQELRERERGAPVRLEVAADCDPSAVERLCGELGIGAADLVLVDGPLNLKELWPLTSTPGFDHLRDKPFAPQVIPALREADESLFAVIRRGDLLFHHPYDSFDSIVEFVRQAADDPRVLAIKQTLYRTSGDSPVIAALQRAAENGKQVSALVELKARFDEGNNINWARQLEEVGVHVVYGLIGLKTHCKVLLVVRRDRDRIRSYVHLGTGNYHPSTAKLYTDLGLLTCDDDLAADVQNLFNIITGFGEFPAWRKLAVAPRDLKPRLLAMLAREAEHARAGRPARFCAKVNAVIEPDIIDALYAASQAGVEIELICRGICGLVPGLPGVSETIRVRSIVGRFLEHSRIYYFANGGAEEVYLASADLMDRNLNRRIETMFPILQPDLRRRVVDEVLGLALRDTAKARLLQPDGTWRPIEPPPGEPALSSQEEFMRLAIEQAPFGETRLGAGARFILQRLRGGRRDQAA